MIRKYLAERFALPHGNQPESVSLSLSLSLSISLVFLCISLCLFLAFWSGPSFFRLHFQLHRASASLRKRLLSLKKASSL